MADERALRACDDGYEDAEQAETWDDWVDDAAESFACVFCAETLAAEDALHVHLEAAHGFSLRQQIRARQLDTYGVVRLVNFLRQARLDGTAPDEVKQQLETLGTAAFAKDEFLKPVIPDDPLLYCLDVDSDDDDSDAEQEEKLSEPVQAAKVASAAQQIEKLSKENQELKEQMAKYSRLLRDFVLEEDTSAAVAGPVEDKADNDTYYFDSYSHVGIHREMITDRVRTDGYRNAILNNPELFKGKVVLDVGCGTGILSMFAAKAGAAKVIGIDQSEMGTVARQVVADNGLSDIVTIIKGKVEELELPVDKVDVIISEWMGYCLLYESMLDTVLFARDKWLAPGGNLFPDKCSMFIQGVQDSTKRFDFWDEVYGFNMRAVKEKVTIRDGFVEDVDSKDIITSRELLKAIDIDHVTYEQLDFRANFTLKVETSGTFHGFVSSFDIGFERGCARPEYFTTGCEGTPTHWHQVFFHIDHPFSVSKGDTLEGKWWVRRNAENPRFLDVEIEWKSPNSTDNTFTAQSFRIH